MKAKSITLTLKVLSQEGKSTFVVQELDILNPTEQRQIVDFLQRTIAEAYERAIKDGEDRDGEAAARFGGPP